MQRIHSHSTFRERRETRGPMRVAESPTEPLSDAGVISRGMVTLISRFPLFTEIRSRLPYRRIGGKHAESG
jgi:hypothetical protein